MLSYPDFSEKQLVCIMSETTRSLRLENDNLVIEENGEIVEKMSCHRLFAVFLIGEGTITTRLIHSLGEFGIVFVGLRRNFDPYMVVGAESEGNTILRESQYKHILTEPVASAIIDNKIANQIALLKNIREKNKIILHSIEQCERLKESLSDHLSNEKILGSEGNVSQIFFRTYFADIGWTGRSPRTKHNIPNLLLDIGYTYLFHFIEALLRIYGFDIYRGVFHTDFYQRKSLVCDIMEPFRCIIDQTLLRAYHLSQIHERDFYFSNGQYGLRIDKASHYTSLFFATIMEHKEWMYRYVQQYYRHVMSNSKQMPFYSLTDKTVWWSSLTI